MIIAETSWSDTAIALGGIFLVAVVIVVIVWQIFSTGRHAVAHSGAKEFREVSEQAAAVQQEIKVELAEMKEMLADLQKRTAEIERVLKEVG